MLVASFAAVPAFALDAGAPQGTAASVVARAVSDVRHRARQVNFEGESASADARQVADWVIDTDDNYSLPFLIVDKVSAKVFVFHADGRLRGATSALLGLAVGDDSVPGIGERKLSSIRLDERTTPAGRFVANLDHNLHGGEILWVDYDAAISLHPVATSNAKERRAERLATLSPLDNRISYGCINVPADFFKNVVSAALKARNGIVYVLPETRSPQKVFAFDDVNAQTSPHRANQGQPLPLVAQAAAD